MCMVPSPWDPLSHRKKLLLGHHISALSAVGAGTVTFMQHSRDNTARAACRGVLVPGWIRGSPAATQPQG